MNSLRLARRRGMLGLAVVGGIVIGSSYLMPGRTRAAPPAIAPAKELAGLQQQRIETLRQASELAHQSFAQGIASAGETFRIDRLLLDAQLESAATAEERVKFLRSALDVARKQEDVARKQVEAGLASPLAGLEAKADRLRIEIRLAEMGAK